MRYIFIAFLLLSTVTAKAQADHIYIDASLPIQNMYGGSFTVNHVFVKHFGIGIGAQAYNFKPTPSNEQKLTPAVFADIRLAFDIGKNGQVFPFVDLGVNFYQHTDGFYGKPGGYYKVVNNNGVYTGFGLGYFHRVAKHGSGLYASLKLEFNSYSVDNYFAYYGSTGKNDIVSDGHFVGSVGYRF